MKKILFILFALLPCLQPIKAQPKVVMSESFDKPSSGWNKLIQLKNGNTFYLHFTKRDGIDVTVYDKNRKIISEKNISSELWNPKKMKESSILGLYEINGQPVIFLEQYPDLAPTLYRLRLDANTGVLTGEKELGALPRISVFRGFGGANAINNQQEMSDFHVEKDPQSDYYAVVMFNGRRADKSNEGIEVTHYDGNHKEINHAFYTTPGDPFKYLHYVGMTVDKDKEVFLCTYGCNNLSGGEDGRIILSKLEKGNKDFKHNLLDLGADFNSTRGQLLYNPGSNMLQLLSLTMIRKQKKIFSDKTTTYYAVLLSYFDPQTLTTINTKQLTAEKVSAYLQNQLGRSEGFSGMPQGMVINNDNSTTILMEELESIQKSNGHVVIIQTLLQNIGISEMDEAGREKEGYAILKKQLAEGLFPYLYLTQKRSGSWTYESTGPFTTNYNAFLSYDYVNTDKGKYIIFNDLPKNIGKDEDEKRAKVFNPGNTSTIYYQLNNGVMDKHYLFSNGNEDGPNYYSYIASSHYERETNTYATVIVERDGKDKEARIAWVSFP